MKPSRSTGLRMTTSQTNDTSPRLLLHSYKSNDPILETVFQFSVRPPNLLRQGATEASAHPIFSVKERPLTRSSPTERPPTRPLHPSRSVRPPVRPPVRDPSAHPSAHPSDGASARSSPTERPSASPVKERPPTRSSPSRSVRPPDLLRQGATEEAFFRQGATEIPDFYIVFCYKSNDPILETVFQ